MLAVTQVASIAGMPWRLHVRDVIGVCVQAWGEIRSRARARPYKWTDGGNAQPVKRKEVVQGVQPEGHSTLAEMESHQNKEDNVNKSRNRLLALTSALLAVLLLATTVFAGDNRNYTASLKGRNEVPAVPSNGQGQAIFHLSEDGSALDYKLIVANIDNVTQSHIHCGADGVNGPVVAFLFGFVAGGVTENGVLAEGTITPANVIPRPDSPACPGGVADFADLLEKMNSGEAYVNVHTVAFPGGEIRGQIQ